MKTKRSILMCLAVVLSLSMALSSTLAYLQDSDSDVNVMTLGNVEIEQIEQEWNADKTELVPFTQGKPLYPYVGELRWENNEEEGDAYRRFDTNNVVDKYVSVKNTGKSPAYVRTIIALEMGEYESVDEFYYHIVGTSHNSSSGTEFPRLHWEWDEKFVAQIDGQNYCVMVATYDEALQPADTTIPSLLQVYLNKEAGNDEVEKLDGNKNGTYDILVVSQAAQVMGFDSAETALNTAFGEVTASSHPWIDIDDPDNPKDQDPDGFTWPILGGDAEGLQNALTNGGSVALQGDVEDDFFNIPADKEVVIDLGGNELAANTNITNDGDLTINDGYMSGTYFQNNGTAEISDVHMKTGTKDDYSNISAGADAETTYNNVDVTSNGGGIGATDGAQVTFNSGSVKIIADTTNPRYNIYAEGSGTKVTINDGEFSFTSSTLKRAYIYAGKGATVEVNGGTFGAASSRQGYTDGILGEGTIIIKGGTFGFDPNKWVAEGYKAEQNGSTWTVSAE